MNRKYEKNLSKQKLIEEKIESMKSELQDLKDEQEEMENVEVLKGYRSIDISIDEFLEIIKNHKKEKAKEKEQLKEPDKSKDGKLTDYQNYKNNEKITETNTEEKSNVQN